MAEKAKTIVEYFAEHERYKCGYCGKKDTNYSHGMWAHAMNVQDYQDLLDRGWRRSGKYTYKPTMDLTCCPQYTIRCQVQDFKLRKSHKKVLKKVNKYLIHGIKPSKGDADLDDGEPGVKPVTQTSGQNAKSTSGEQPLPTTTGIPSKVTSSEQKGGSELKPVVSGDLSEACDKQGSKTEGESDFELKSEEAPTSANVDITSASSNTNSREIKRSRPGSGMDPTKPLCKKAKDIRREKKLAKQAAKGVIPEHVQKTSTSSEQNSKTLEDILNEPKKAEKCAHKLEIRLVRSYPESPEFRDSLTESHSVYHRYQMSIHGDDADKPVLKQYKRFLVDSPLEEEYEEGGLPDGYGSFHQQYILDGKIICVGVLDILPSLVSSKYLYYDPDYSFLSLGTFSALQEIAFIRSLHKFSKRMQYYYMGFYIHSCPKMKYKGQYFPSFLLCPETYTWHPVEKCAELLDRKKYSSFADEDQVDAQGTPDFSSLLVLHHRRIMSYEQYLTLTNHRNNDEEEVAEYAKFVGKKSAKRMLLYRK